MIDSRKMRKRDVPFSLVKHARFSVTAVIAATVLYTRSPQVVWCAAGGVTCSVVARVLKAIIRQPRPVQIEQEIQEVQQDDGEWVETSVSTNTTDASNAIASGAAVATTTTITARTSSSNHDSRKRRVIKRVFASSVHGMPSSHTQVTTFLSTYFTLAVFATPDPLQHTFLLGILCVCVNVFGLTTAWSRVHLNRHTPAQVAVGYIIGTAFAVAWYSSWQYYGVRDMGESMFHRIGLR
ncbi:hypothetical protein DFJ77DRAFT_359063 [Powellomyces hirtus]|nr:hypothetical protein DFJ77DRAFT_359063 [Powellomyces hirtus]